MRRLKTIEEFVDTKFDEIMLKDTKLKIAEAFLHLEMQMRIRKPKNRISPMEKRIIEEKANQLKKEINIFIDSQLERIINSSENPE
ncbi:MAG: hypothetical protein IJ439_03770 [Tyzzerella sp.]|nr:hypothetical protein [Tyzzerella sp.]